MRITFGIGIGFTANGTPIPSDEAERLITRAILATTHRYGGCFVTRGEGAWRSPRGDVIREPGISVTVDTDNTDDEVITTHAKLLKALFSQEMVAVSTIASEPSFV